MVECGLAQHIKDRACRAGLWVRSSKYNPWNAGKDDRPGAHGAGLEGHEECRPRKPPAPECGRCLANREQLGMSGRVEIDLTPVACGGDHFAIPHDHRTDRNVIVFGGKSGLGKREFHVGFVRLHRSSLRNQKL